MLKALPFTLSCSVLAMSLTLAGCAQQPQQSAHSASSASISGIAQNTDNTAESAVFSKMLDDIMQYEATQFPSIAKSLGQKTVDLPRQLTDISMPALKARNAKFVDFRNSLDAINENSLNESEKVTLLMQKYRLDNYISEFEYKDYRIPITSEYGFHSSLGGRFSGMQIQNAQSIAIYKQMLRELPAQFTQNIAYMKEGLAAGHTQPKIVLQGYDSTITAFIIDDLNADNIQQHPFFKPITAAKDGVVNRADKAEFVALIKAANQSYQDFYAFFTQQYVPQANDDIAAKNWPDGMAFYNNRIKHYTTTDLSAQEIYDIGLEEVARIRSQMQDIVDNLNEKGEFKGNITEFIDYLRTDERFYAKTADDLIMYASYVAKQMDAKLPELFYTLPRKPYGVAPVPEDIAPKYTTGRYVSPSSDDKPGYYWVNTYALNKRPLYSIPALTLHEAVPGHHLQISLAAEMDELPEVRRSTYISAFGEGWGLYSEFLGIEADIYKTPYENFGRLSYEMWRACRLVVDTGMHVFGWTRQQAFTYMLENTALSEHNVGTEIDRYISWPGQALAYKIGEIKIKELRILAERELGDKFDLRAFHDAVLANGSIPLFVLEQKVNAFIAQQKINK